KAIIGDFAKQWCRELFMPTWNEYELKDCWNYLYKEKLTLKFLRDKFEICGGIARWIFTMSLEVEMDIEKAIKTVKSEILYHQGQILAGDEYTHKLIYIHINIEKMEEKIFDNIKEIQERVKYFRSTSKTFERIDSYAHPNNLFQVTVSRKHSIKQDGLRAIKDILDENYCVKIYFVLLREIFKTFKRKQSYENKGKERYSTLGFLI
ncbi:13109_t:CDS:2, partial [Funneliformis mosseae]